MFQYCKWLQCFLMILWWFVDGITIQGSFLLFLFFLDSQYLPHLPLISSLFLFFPGGFEDAEGWQSAFRLRCPSSWKGWPPRARSTGHEGPGAPYRCGGLCRFACATGNGLWCLARRPFLSSQCWQHLYLGCCFQVFSCDTVWLLTICPKSLRWTHQLTSIIINQHQGFGPEKKPKRYSCWRLHPWQLGILHWGSEHSADLCLGPHRLRSSQGSDCGLPFAGREESQSRPGRVAERVGHRGVWGSESMWQEGHCRWDRQQGCSPWIVPRVPLGCREQLECRRCWS